METSSIYTLRELCSVIASLYWIYHYKFMLIDAEVLVLMLAFISGLKYRTELSFQHSLQMPKPGLYTLVKMIINKKYGFK